MPHRETLNQLRTLKEQATDKSMIAYQASQGIKQAIDLASSLPKIKDNEMNVELAAYIKQYQDSVEFKVFTSADLLSFCKTILKIWDNYLKVQVKYQNSY